MQFPAHFIEHIDRLPGYAAEAFRSAHQSPPPTSVRLNPFKPVSLPYISTHIPWSVNGRYLVKRPSFTFDPLFHAGAYYVQEASSQLIEQVWNQHVDRQGPLRVLDLCAAPGGKSTHLLSLMREDDLLVCNEVIRGRTGILADNIARWGKHNVIVTQADPAVLGKLQGFFDVILVDAPCSGSGLFRKDTDAMDHWSLSSVDHCAARQRRILTDIWPSLRQGGILIYSTCSYSELENEQMVDWVSSEYDALPLSMETLKEWGVVATSAGYRCWPHLVRGEGFFLMAWRKNSMEKSHQVRGRSGPSSLPKQSQQTVRSYWPGEGDLLLDWNKAIWALPEVHAPGLQGICSVTEPLRIGIQLGSLVRTELIPDHALGLSVGVSQVIPRKECTLDECVRYLQRGTVELAELERGWQLVTYQGLALGWIKSLGNRINNYYPLHLRILKQSIQGVEEKNQNFDR